MTNYTPLPDLERELTDAARRLDGAADAGRRRWWRHGWALLSLVLVTAGAGVAAARVAHVGPFAYLDRFTSNNPNLATLSTISVDAGGPEPAWKAVAQINKIGELCLTGGPRDLRTNPDAAPTRTHPNYPPGGGMTCSDSDSIAEALVDPHRPGATFASSSPLDGSPAVNMLRSDRHGHFVAMSHDYATRALVFAVAAQGVTPVVRWGATGAAIRMRPSAERLRLAVDKSPDGLSLRERQLVAIYPNEIEIVLWAAEVPYPKGVTQAQVVSASELMPDGVDDATVEMLSLPQLFRRDRAGRAAGWKYEPGITREAMPVHGTSKSERAHVAAFARARTRADAVPRALRKPNYDRIRYSASRRLTIAGGGLSHAWLAPGGVDAHEAEVGHIDRVCPVGAPFLGQCKNDTRRWKRPVVEAVLCARALKRGETLVWALTPTGATGTDLLYESAATEHLPPAELIALRRRRGRQPTAIRWRLPTGDVTVRVPWPNTPVSKCGRRPPSWILMRRDSIGGSEMAGGPNSPRPR